MSSASNCNLRVALHRWAALCSVVLCLAVASSMAVAGPPDRGPIWADPHARGWPFRRAGPPQTLGVGGFLQFGRAGSAARALRRICVAAARVGKRNLACYESLLNDP